MAGDLSSGFGADYFGAGSDWVEDLRCSHENKLGDCPRCAAGEATEDDDRRAQLLLQVRAQEGLAEGIMRASRKIGEMVARQREELILRVVCGYTGGALVDAKSALEVLDRIRGAIEEGRWHDAADDAHDVAVVTRDWARAFEKESLRNSVREPPDAAPEPPPHP